MLLKIYRSLYISYVQEYAQKIVFQKRPLIELIY